MPKNTKHVPTKGRERSLPVIARNPNGLHAAKSNSGRSALHDEESQPDPMMSTDLSLQDDATRLTITTNNGDDSSKRKAAKREVSICTPVVASPLRSDQE
jgi:hypothetical protein